MMKSKQPRSIPTRDGESLGADDDGDVTGYSRARQAVTISHRDPEVFATLQRQPEATHRVPMEEVVCRARVQERQQPLPFHHDGKQQGLVRAYAREGVQRDHQRVGPGSVSCHRRLQVTGVLLHRNLADRVVNEVVHLEVKEPLAHVPPDVGLIAVEAEPLPALLLLLGRGEAAELAHRGSALAGYCCAGRRYSRRCWQRAGGSLRPLRWPRPAWLRWWWHGRRAALERPSQIHGCLQVLRRSHLDIHPKMLGKAAHVQLRLLESGDVACSAQQRLEAVRVLLDRRQEGEASQLGDA